MSYLTKDSYTPVHLDDVPLQYNTEKARAYLIECGGDFDEDFEKDVAHCQWQAYVENAMNGGGVPVIWEFLIKLNLTLFRHSNAERYAQMMLGLDN